MILKESLHDVTHCNIFILLHESFHHIPFGVTFYLVDPLQPTVLAPLEISSKSQTSLVFIDFIHLAWLPATSASDCFPWLLQMMWDHPPFEILHYHILD
jgi:hypothetical protein